MTNKVFANNNELACKAGQGKSICCFPDVCMTPPENPATPPGVPVPYPNTAFASDTTDGSRTVQISGKEVMLKDKSYFKKSTGDEAGCAAKKGVVTSVNKGEVFFTSWSMDVKIEGENADRNLDLTVHNEACSPPNTVTWPFIDEVAVASETHPCHEDHDAARTACQGCETLAAQCDEPKCRKAKQCVLVPKGAESGSPNCCEGQQGHHLIEDHWVRGQAGFPQSYVDAPTVCAEGGRYDSEHGTMHAVQGVHEESFIPPGVNSSRPWNYGAGKRAALRAHLAAFGNNCSRRCLERQLDNYYGSDSSRPLKTPSRRQPLGEERRLYGQVVVDALFSGPKL
jgi:hypothetical protein